MNLLMINLKMSLPTPLLFLLMYYWTGASEAPENPRTTVIKVLLHDRHDGKRPVTSGQDNQFGSVRVGDERTGVQN